MTFSPKHNTYGKTTMEYFIISSDGNDVSRAMVTIDVKATHLLVAKDDIAETDEDTSVTINVLANDSNNGGDPLLVDTAWVKMTTSGRQNGTVVVNGDNTITFTPKPNFHGSVQIGYAMTDDPDCSINNYGGCGHNSIATVTVKVKPVNDPPIAKDDQVTTGVGTPVTVPLLWNDTDVDGDSKQLVSFTQPAHGSVARIVGDVFQNVRYTPHPSFAGNDSFTYTMSDGHGGESTATVHIKVNHLPKAKDIIVKTAEDTPVDIDVSSSVSDLDSTDKLSLPYAAWAKHGTVTKISDTVLRYLPSKDYYGGDTFLYTITDGKAVATAKVNVTVTPVNDSPFVEEDTVTTPLNTSVRIPVLANDGDAEGDPLTVSIATGPKYGTVAVNPDGSITYTPAPDSKGKDTFWYTVGDGNSTSPATKVDVFVGHLLPLQDPELLTLLKELNADAKVSREDMIKLLRSTTDNSAVDLFEIKDVELIVKSQLLTIQAHVRALASYVLDNNNLANNNYQGKPLEKLLASATSSVVVMNSRIYEHFFGMDRPEIPYPYKYTKAPSRTLFVNPLRAEDYPQGVAGDCYAVAEVRAIIHEKLDVIIEDAMIDNKDDTWTIRLFNGKNAEYVTVDNYLPTDAKGNLVYVGSGIPIKDAQLEIPLWEKGYAQANEKGHLGQEEAKNSYDAISGGWPANVVRQMTGISANEYWNLKSADQAALDQALANNWPVTVTTWTEDPRIVNNHVYTILKSGNGYYWENPWGEKHFSGPFSDIQKHAWSMIIFDPSKYVSTNAGSSISSETIPVGEPLFASAAPDSFLASSSFDPTLFRPSVIDAVSVLEHEEDLPKSTEALDNTFATFDPTEPEDLDDIGLDVEKRTKKQTATDDLFSSLSHKRLADELLAL